MIANRQIVEDEKERQHKWISEWSAQRPHAARNHQIKVCLFWVFVALAAVEILWFR